MNKLLNFYLLEIIMTKNTLKSPNNLLTFYLKQVFNYIYYLGGFINIIFLVIGLFGIN